MSARKFWATRRKLYNMKLLRGKFPEVKKAIDSLHLETLEMTELGNDLVEIEIVNMNAVPWSLIREQANKFNVELIGRRK